jgi:hypothetical protein
MNILKVMSNPPNTIKMREKLQSKGQQQEKAYKQETHTERTQSWAREPSQRGSAAPKGQALERELHVHS